MLALNAGSATLKYRLDRAGEVLAAGQVERIGDARAQLARRGRDGEADHEVIGPVPDVATAVRLVLAMLPGAPLHAVGHRIVHGGDRFTAPAVLDDRALVHLRELAPLAPLHNPAAVSGIEAAREAFPGVPQIGVFDTALHAGMPVPAHRYSLPADITAAHRIRRYGFHGISHGYVARRTAEHLGRSLGELCLVTLHLGNGASAAAIHSGRSIDTSMGLTPLSGLIMGTRGGDVDAGVVFHLHRAAGLSIEEIEDLLTHGSGLKGLAGVSDMRDVHRRAAAGDGHAIEAIETYCYRIRCCVGAYAAALGRLDGIVFTAGIGEHDPEVRARVCAGLAGFGVRLDTARNAAATALTQPRTISADGSPVAVTVVPTDEEAEIVTRAREVLASAGGPVPGVVTAPARRLR
ncbi:acetate/propionate family kinase [Pseudonocardia sp. CA-107938]|uniref:acetate/propionate family kinase n=1 Tax=Pseudonocardia sp. CA-107938 TaxID=3240021 RepID=UPI003D8FD7A7